MVASCVSKQRHCCSVVFPSVCRTDTSQPEQSQRHGNTMGAEEQGLHLGFCGVSKTHWPAKLCFGETWVQKGK